MTDYALPFAENGQETIFADLFQYRKNLLRIYQSLHPEDTSITEENIFPINLNSIILDTPYNDLCFFVDNGRLISITESSAAWSDNLVLRAFVNLRPAFGAYLFSREECFRQARYMERFIPEIYGLYWGETLDVPETLSLAHAFFPGMDPNLNLEMKVLTEENAQGILKEYILFSKTVRSCEEQYGSRPWTTPKIIRICEQEGLLDDYLEERGETAAYILSRVAEKQKEVRSYVRTAQKEAVKKRLLQLKDELVEAKKLDVEQISVFFPEISSEEPGSQNESSNG